MSDLTVQHSAFAVLGPLDLPLDLHVLLTRDGTCMYPCFTGFSWKGL